MLMRRALHASTGGTSQHARCLLSAPGYCCYCQRDPPALPAIIGLPLAAYNAVLSRTLPPRLPPSRSCMLPAGQSLQRSPYPAWFQSASHPFHLTLHSSNSSLLTVWLAYPPAMRQCYPPMLSASLSDVPCRAALRVHEQVVGQRNRARRRGCAVAGKRGSKGMTCFGVHRTLSRNSTGRGSRSG